MKQYALITLEDKRALNDWHESLEKNRGDRARLRRAETPEDLLLTDAFFHFLEAMPETSEYWRNNMLESSAVAGALAHVKQNKQIASRLYKNNKPDDSKTTNASFAEQLATPLEGKSKAPMSELRFQQLQKSKTSEDFYRRILRAIRLLDGKVNIISLADDIIHWHREFQHTTAVPPAKRLAVRWATDYFSALSN